MCSSAKGFPAHLPKRYKPPTASNAQSGNDFASKRQRLESTTDSRRCLRFNDCHRSQNGSHTLPGAYIIKYEATGVDNLERKFVRYAQVDFTIPRAAAYTYTPDDLPENFTGYQELLGESSIPLVGVPTHAISDTPWKKYSLIVIAPDSAQADRHWQTPEARDVISNSKRPILGLYNGGYALFGDWGLSLGANVVRTSNMTWTTPFNGADPIWSLPPFPLAGGAPYTVYTTTPGLSIDLGSAQPGVDFIGLLPPTPRNNIALEDNRFLLWGFARGPDDMTFNGRRLFANVGHLLP